MLPNSQLKPTTAAGRLLDLPHAHRRSVCGLADSSAETAMIKDAFSRTQIDRLGDRLKGGSHTESDLRLLDDYRRSFGEAYETVVRTLRQRGEVPTGRLAKSTVSIAEKLRRESIRLSQMQDIAGCRIVVGNVVEQEQLVASLKADFPGASLIDRRDHPSHGYRAVHVIAEISGKPVEIQVRTSLQHMWANLSEKSSDVLDPTIKYGGGPDGWRDFLTKSSKSVATYEKFEKTHAEAVALNEVFEKSHSKAVSSHEVFEKATAELLEHHLPEHEVEEIRGKLEDSRLRIEGLSGKLEDSRLGRETSSKELVALWNGNADLLTGAITWLDKLKGQKQ